ncbi:mannitol dehydrogenase family protein [Sphaerochaeta halotolerans]|jgi:fructuronate reductase|uniref:mannitol dehydrogenase family protein n=1 Tax=Sphaerochaeta halotolerans TaxID=2293840 RepID=UPI00136EC33C|nr:mannitol dehydrogenase family protein [Sphaerochaeta halotolerans]MXI85217.1 mannitol dehydrogenase family protein [Sphaerochaeta halotolerans]
MKLTNTGLQNRSEWEEKGYVLPSFDRTSMIQKTKEHPTWVHFGAGNIFRIFPAALQQRLLSEGLGETGIIVGEGFDYQIIDEVYEKHDNLTLMVTLKSDGTIGKEVIASVAAAYKCDQQFSSEWEFFKKTFRSPSLQMASFTITEKGYALKRGDGSFHPAIEKDLQAGPAQNIMFLPRLTALMYERYLSGGGKLALVSMDNCSHNGEKLQNAVMTIAEAWEENGLVKKGFVSYLRKDVSFPWSMIDKITPRPDAKVAAMLKADGFEDTSMVITDKNTYTAAFVNAEEPQYLVIEDDFPAGRPQLEKAGVYFTDRDTVNKVERMKVTTCLNPLHTTLAIYGCLLSHSLISEEMQDPQLKRMVEIIGYEEGMPVVTDPKILDPKAFIDEVLTVRFPNPFMPDTPQRIATDTSQKLAIRFGETIKSYLASDQLKVSDLKLIPLVFAGWLRYLMGLDDELNLFTPSPDPRLEEAQAYLKDITIGMKGPFPELKGLLKDESIWGVNLLGIGMADLVLSYFAELIAGKGAVRKTLLKYVK